jgi:putative zinc finger protein
MTHVQADIGAFVLGALDSDAERRVREHLATCPECAAAHADLAGIPGLLDLAVVTGATEDEPLPPAIEERLLDRFARERVERPERRRWRPRIALGLSSALAGAAVAVAALVFGMNFERNGGRPASQYRLAFERIGPAPANASARAGLRTSEAGTVVRLWVNNLPTGDVYEVWCDAKGWSASAGTFRVDAKGDAYVILTTAVKKGQYDRIRLVRREHLASGKVVPSDILAAKLS